MSTDTHYWLNRVAVKLYELFLSGEELRKSRRWIFDWDGELTIEENLVNAAAEDKALAIFTISGIIETESLNNRYRDYLQRNPQNPPTGSGEWGNLDEPDQALLEYDRARFLEALYYDKFVEFCEDQGLNYKEDAIPATLEITNQVPIVHVGDRTYTLKTLQDGSPLDVIQAAYDHAGERFGFKELRQWTKKTFDAQKRFTDIFRKNEFSKGHELSPFVDITPQTFMLKKQASLTPAQLSAIQKNSTD